MPLLLVQTQEVTGRRSSNKDWSEKAEDIAGFCENTDPKQERGKVISKRQQRTTQKWQLCGWAGGHRSGLEWFRSLPRFAEDEADELPNVSEESERFMPVGESVGSIGNKDVAQEVDARTIAWGYVRVRRAWTGGVWKKNKSSSSRAESQ